MAVCRVATPADKAVYRESISEVLERIKRYDPNCQVEWVWTLLETGAAELVIVENERSPEDDPCFYVMGTVEDYPDAWYCIAGGSLTGRAPDLPARWDSLTRFAQELGFRRVMFSSPRAGWLSRFRKSGFRLVNALYEREV